MALRPASLLALLRPTNLVATALLAALGYGGYLYYDYCCRARNAQLERQQLEESVAKLEKTNSALRETIQTLETQVAELRLFVKRLTAESRIADVRILNQRRDVEGVPITTLEFVERDRDGKALPTRSLTVRGQEVYFDALVIQFSEKDVMAGDPLRGKSLHLFRRAFGSAQEPRDGPLIATAERDGVPDIYRVTPAPSAFEQRLWRLFWHWADHPAEAEQEGVSVAQIKAVGIRPVVGAAYRITLKHAGALSIKRVEANP